MNVRSGVASLSPIALLQSKTQGFTILQVVRYYCGVHFFNALVTSRAPVIRLGGRTLINASPDPLACLPTPPLLL